VNLRRLGTRLLGLFVRTHQCADGPMQGEQVALSEHSNSTAWLEVRGEVGRYVTDKRGRLTWEKRK
jgi:hypothetical protein